MCLMVRRKITIDHIKEGQKKAEFFPPSKRVDLARISDAQRQEERGQAHLPHPELIRLEIVIAERV